MIPLPPHVIIGFLLDHTKEVIDYINDVKDASKDQNNLFDELVATQTVLSQLRGNADDDNWKETMGALCTAGGPFDQLKVELKSMESKLKRPTGMISKTGRALGWHFTKDGVMKHFARLERIKSFLHLAVQNNHQYIPAKTDLIVESLPKHFKRTLFASKKCSKVRTRRIATPVDDLQLNEIKSMTRKPFEFSSGFRI